MGVRSPARLTVVAGVIGALVVVATPALAQQCATIDPSQDLSGATDTTNIANALNNDSCTEVVLNTGNFYVKGSTCDAIGRKVFTVQRNNQVVRGQGQGQTIINLIKTDCHDVGFWLTSPTGQGQISNVWLHDFSIRGSIAETADADEKGWRQTAVYTNPSSQLANLQVTKLEISSVTHGIEVNGSNPGANISDALVADNWIHDIRGTLATQGLAGNGYGIHAAETPGLVIRNNLIEQVERHSIYIGANGVSPGVPPVRRITVRNNRILRHGHTTFMIRECAALVIARSKKVTAAHNTIVDSHTHAISVEDDSPPYLSDSAILIDNRILRTNSAAKDIWLNTASDVKVWGNLRDGNQSPNVLITQTTQGTLGTVTDCGGAGKFWQNTKAISEMNGYVYVMQQGTSVALHRVNPDYDNDPCIGWRSYIYEYTDWTGLQDMTAADGVVYVAKNDTLYRVTPGYHQTYWTSTSSSGWFNFATFMAPGDSYLYVVQNGTLHRVSPTWGYTYSNGNWAGTTAIAFDRAASGARLYLVQNGVLNRVTVGGLWTSAYID